MSMLQQSIPSGAPRVAGPIAVGARIGHVHLKVADLDKSLDFYIGVLGFTLRARSPSGSALLAAGDYHHHIALNTWTSRNGEPPGPGMTGLYHVAILYPTRSDLADALRRVLAANVQVMGATDHGVSEAIYLDDPDHNGLELCWDRPTSDWPRDQHGALVLRDTALRLPNLLAEE